MTYRKFKADYLFNGQEMAGKDSVLITSGDGTVQSVVPVAEAGEGVEVYPGLLSPGFINCHCHLELSHMKGVIPGRTGLVDFLSAVIRRRNPDGRKPDTRARQGRAYGPAEGGTDGPEGGNARGEGHGETRGGAQGNAHPVDAGDQQDRVREAIAAGEQEMLDGGIVAVGDICNTADTLAAKRADRLSYHNFIETMGFIEAGAPARFAHSKGVFEEFEEVFPGSNSIVPHAPYSVSPALFRLIADFPGNRLLTMHNQESREENVFLRSGKGDFLRLYQLLGLDISFFSGTGKTSPESCLPYFHKGQTMILVHNVATREEDLRGMMGAGDGGSGGPSSGGGPDLFFCLCPNANLYIDGVLPDVDAMMRHGCRLVVGTDSLASNHQLSILEELKTLQLAFPQLGTPTLLEWATVNGARALQMDGALGSFIPGKRPGVVLLGGLEEGRFTAETTAVRLL
jgi:cytosine/adenosine deaminase-related metal-dependent hydrolase